MCYFSDNVSSKENIKIVWLTFMFYYIHTRLTMYYIRALIYDFLSGFLYVLVLEVLRSVLETLGKYMHVHSKNA